MRSVLTGWAAPAAVVGIVALLIAGGGYALATGGGTAYEAVRASGPTGVLHGTDTFPPSPLKTVATLHLPAGSYDIRGITNVQTDEHSMVCALTAGGNRDIAEGQVESGWDAGINLATEVLHTFTKAGVATLACASEGSTPSDTWSARNTTITANPVTSVRVSPVTG
jgi:hypothetical protein